MFTRHNINNDWIKMMMVLAFAGVAMSALGGNLNAPAAPTDSASAMWTLENIYNVLDTRTTNVIKRAGAAAFAEPAGLPTNGTMHTLNDIMTLVTNRAPVPKTGQTNSFVPYDGGWYRTNFGVAWPTQRFTAVATSGDATNQIRDNMTGLIWARDASNACGLAVAKTNWDTAIPSCTNMTYGGASDWRLPNVRELHSLVSYGFYPGAFLCNTAGTGQWTEGNPFIGVVAGIYWTSTTFPGWTAGAWYVDLSTGGATYADKAGKYYVWPVRGGGQ